jgi:anti-sigma factor RsiW
MRHIPEDELHAYLDQALSRSQCVEIESHLAGCTQCQDHRDGIAALRDRTTALLSTLAPPRRFTPAVEVLQERAAARSARRATRWRAAAWAASVVVALGLGWAGKSVNERGMPSGVETELAAAPDAGLGAPGTAIEAADSLPGRTDAAPVPAADAGSPRAGRPAPGAVPSASAAEARTQRVAAFPDTIPLPRPSMEPVGTVLSSGQLLAPNLDAATGTVFRTVSWASAERERGASVPRIAGLPVMEVQVGTSGQSGGKPLVVVAQQLESGQVIRTIEGPATDVNKLLASRHSEDGSPWPAIGDSAGGIAGGDGAMTYRRGDRILAITAPLPSDSLRAMIRRLNVTER